VGIASAAWHAGFIEIHGDVSRDAFSMSSPCIFRDMSRAKNVCAFAAIPERACQFSALPQTPVAISAAAAPVPP
jgi:hypothetical protein